MKHWNEAAAEALNSVRSNIFLDVKSNDRCLNNSIILLRRRLVVEREPTSRLYDPILGIGMAARDILRSMGAWDQDEFLKLLCRKQHDYGHDNINSFGVVGVAVRLSDKVARYFNLKSKGVEGEAEPFIDSLLDMVGYAVISEMLRNDTFNLELEVQS